MTEREEGRTPSCEFVWELLPACARGELDPDRERDVQEHLDRCPECRDEARSVATLWRLRPEPDPELEGRIRKAVAGVSGLEPGGVRRASRTGARSRAPWLLPAAAVAAAILGGALFWESEIRREPPGGETFGIGVILSEEGGGLFPSDDGVVAGSAVLDRLTDDELTLLLEEMEG